jgi:putative ABC transport system permease protein
LVKQLGWENPIGKQMLKASDDDGKTQPKKVIGVTADFHTYSLQHKVEPLVLTMPEATNEQDNLYVKIAKGKTAAGLAWLKNIYAKFDNSNTAGIHFLDENFEKQYAAEHKQEQLSLSFTLLAFIVACLGLLGLVIFSTSQRIKEIGIRKILGASVTSITVMLSKDFIMLVFIACLIAVPVSWIVMKNWLQEFAYRIDIEWWMFLLSGCIAILIAIVTVSFQAIRAAIANPVKSLRTE